MNLVYYRRKVANYKLWNTLLVVGIILGSLGIRLFPPPPVYSENIGRFSYWQSYETSYFTSLRSIESTIQDSLSRNRIPVVILGDSTLRGTGASKGKVWTKVLERQLQEFEPRVQVINLAQNAGDLLAPFLYHHLNKLFPEAYYIVQWHFPSEVGVRHPFHYWLTSEIAIKDGKNNPAVKRSFATVPIQKWNIFNLLKSGLSDEQSAFVLARLNILTNYLDIGNWFRFQVFGRIYVSQNRLPTLEPLKEAPDMETEVNFFNPPDSEQQDRMSELFLNQIQARTTFLERDFDSIKDYFDEMYPDAFRRNLLLISLDWNPFYAPQNRELNNIWKEQWLSLEETMSKLPSLNFLTFTYERNVLTKDDFLDLGHLTPKGQAKLAELVSTRILDSINTRVYGGGRE